MKKTNNKLMVYTKKALDIKANKNENYFKNFANHAYFNSLAQRLSINN